MYLILCSLYYYYYILKLLSNLFAKLYMYDYTSENDETVLSWENNFSASFFSLCVEIFPQLSLEYYTFLITAVRMMKWNLILSFLIGFGG